jgi:serine/threonine-protein kinase
VVTPHASFQNDDDPFAPYEVIGELGARPLPVFVARQSAVGAAGGHLVVAERFAGAAKASDTANASLRREARRLTTLANPNLARIREIGSRGDDLVVFGDFIDGEKLAEMWPASGAAMPFGAVPLEVALRVLLDVLTGAGALHGLRDTSQQPMKLTHGELSPSTILLGTDGVARILHAVARRAPDVKAPAASVPYLAPEVHAGDAQDARTDVFSVGVLLWEALEGKTLSPAGTEAAGIRVRSGALPAPNAPANAPWAKALVPVAVRALASNPEDRWPTAAAMAGEIRKAAGLKLAAASAAAAFTRTAFGDHTRERRARWESASKGLRAAAPVAFAAPSGSSRLAAPVPVPAASGPSLITASPASAPRSMPASAPRSMPASAPAPFSAELVSTSDLLPDTKPAPAPFSSDLVSKSDWLPDTRRAPVIAVPPAARSEEYSSSVLESFRPPPPPAAQSLAPAKRPSDAPIDFDSFALPGTPPESGSSADAPLPLEAPVVFDEAPTSPAREFAYEPAVEAAPIEPVFGNAEVADRRRRLQRRVAIGAGAGFLALAAIVIALRGTHPAPADIPTSPASAPQAVTTDRPVAAPPPAAPAPPSASVAAPSPPASASAPATPAPPAKAGAPAAKSKGKGHGGAPRTKSSIVRAAHPKPAG